MYNNKKAITETVSFVFLTLIVVVVSLAAYFVLSGILDNNIEKIDRDNMETYMKKLNFEIQRIRTFDNSSITLPVTFKTGTLKFNQNFSYYQSLVRYADTTKQCIDGLCYYGPSGFERIYFNMTPPYLFSDNITLTPGTHTLTFINNKNAGQIEVRIR